jgi:tetratricopeptide (TPR) repeat protein
MLSSPKNQSSFKESRHYLTEALESTKNIYGPKTIHYYHTLISLANLDKLEGKSHAALAKYQAVYQGLEKTFGITSDLILTLNNIMITSRILGLHTEALTQFQVIEKAISNHQEFLIYKDDLFFNVGIAYATLGKHQEAISFYKESLKIRLKLYDVEPHEKVAHVWNNIAIEYRTVGEIKKSEQACSQNLKIKWEIYQKQNIFDLNKLLEIFNGLDLIDQYCDLCLDIYKTLFAQEELLQEEVAELYFRLGEYFIKHREFEQAAGLLMRSTMLGNDYLKSKVFYTMLANFHNFRAEEETDIYDCGLLGEGT